MKRFYSFCLFFACFSLLKIYAQPEGLTRSCHHMRAGDRIVKQQVEYIEPGRSGENVLWDFSRQESVNDRYELRYYSYEDSLWVGREHRTLYKYILRGDSLLTPGFENQTTLIDNRKPELLLVYPMTYGTRHEDYFHGNGDYGDHLFLTVRGKSSVVADAYGMILLPNGDTLRHVLRTHHQKQIAQRMVPYPLREVSDTVYSPDSIDYHLRADTLRMQVDTYRWYAEGYRYPVFETIENTVFVHQKPQTSFQTSFFYTPSEQYYELDSDPENQFVRERLAARQEEERLRQENGEGGDVPDDLFHFSSRLENHGNDLVIDYCLNAPGQVSMMLFDMQGRQLSGSSPVRQAGGYYQQTFSMYGYQPGEYTLRIVVNDVAFGEKIIK